MAEPLWTGRTVKVHPKSRYSWLDGAWLSCPPGTEVAVVPWPLPTPTREQVRAAILSAQPHNRPDPATDAVMALLSGVPTEDRP